MMVSITAFIGLSCIYWIVSGTLVEVVVRPGDNAAVPCDCEIVEGQDIQWVNICPSQIQPPLIISAYDSLLKPIPRFSVFSNDASKSYDLVIENITEADLGLYYCSRVEKKQIMQNSILFEKDVYHTGDTLIKLTYASPESPPEPVAVDCWQCWLILQTVCPTCSLLSAILAFVCGYRCCHKTVPKESEIQQSCSETQGQLSQQQDAHIEVCYASLNVPKRGNKRTKSNRMQSSDFSVYDGIKLHT
ncbi:hypothetical protein Q8A67_004121 [Cirrhinus molitorella]|uniref:Immunoglobulin domain-containing protein n=1 Tax=Cirrhinus molitorella TaxID=172907 RepID=A0AA88U568_9TELE|nr:hypothetical protein Q8A67_004121 [Cirrhinus molitorella]